MTLPTYVLDAITAIRININVRRSGSWTELTYLLPNLLSLTLYHPRNPRYEPEHDRVFECCTDCVAKDVEKFTVDQYRETLRRWNKHFAMLEKRCPNIEIRSHYCLKVRMLKREKLIVQLAQPCITYHSNARSGHCGGIDNGWGRVVAESSAGKSEDFLQKIKELESRFLEGQPVGEQVV